jgi:hypothetical protein
MHVLSKAALVFAAWLPVSLQAQDVKTTYVPLRPGNAILMEPASPGVKSHVALIYTHPSLNNFTHASGPELSKRGYRVLLLNSYVNESAYEGYAPAISAAIRYLRALPGVDKVLFVTHSGGGPVMTFYQNVAENGPSVCNGPEKLLPCKGNLTGWPKADGLILLDSVPGSSYHQMTSIDPALGKSPAAGPRNASLDMFDPKNGYDPKARSATYSDDFLTRFFAAQSARSNAIIDEAVSRLKKVAQGQGAFKDDEPFPVAGIGVNASGARPYQADVRLVSHTKQPHILVKTDGATATTVIHSTHPPVGTATEMLGTMAEMAQNGTLTRFLATQAVRTTKDFRMTEDSIEGVDWKSSATSVPSNIEGVTVPTLIATMGCHYFVVPSEIYYDHSGAKDKQYVAIEGAAHVFTPCKPEYGDTKKNLFDYVDGWIAKRYVTSAQ